MIEWREVTCPRCSFTHHKRFEPMAKEEGVLVHTCVSGYIRPYPTEICTDCKEGKRDTDNYFMKMDEVVVENRLIKMEEIAE
jgi:hypothetical protein